MSIIKILNPKRQTITLPKTLSPTGRVFILEDAQKLPIHSGGSVITQSNSRGIS